MHQPAPRGVPIARYSRVFKVDHVRPSVVADGIAECQIRLPSVPIVFCEIRKLAREWTYRFLAAAQAGLSDEMVGHLAVRGLNRRLRSRQRRPRPLTYVAGRPRTTSSSPTAAESRRR